MAPLGPEHAACLFAQQRSPELYRFVPTEPYPDVASLEARYRRVAAGPAAPTDRWYNWAVFLRGPETIALGTVELTLVEDGRRASLAYSFGREHWGCGYASEACSAAIDFLRTATPVRSVEALIDTQNERSIALVRRLGFTCLATIENADYFKGRASNEFHFTLALEKDDHGEIEQR